MAIRGSIRRLLFGRDVAIAYAVLVSLYYLRVVGRRPTQIPAYLLIVAYDVVEVLLGILPPYYPIAFPLFLYLLAVCGAAIPRVIRSETGEGQTWHRAAGGVCLVVGTIAFLFAAMIGGPLSAPTDNPTPLAIATVTAIAFFAAGWVLLGRRRGSPVRND
ncbi:MAG: hypothetical protein ABEJ58_08815 [Halodesulfurarchaeum sp.]